jgi:hypothetical protein
LLSVIVVDRLLATLNGLEDEELEVNREKTDSAFFGGEGSLIIASERGLCNDSSFTNKM